MESGTGTSRRYDWRAVRSQERCVSVGLFSCILLVAVFETMADSALQRYLRVQSSMHFFSSVCQVLRHGRDLHLVVVRRDHDETMRTPRAILPLVTLPARQPCSLIP